MVEIVGLGLAIGAAIAPLWFAASTRKRNQQLQARIAELEREAVRLKAENVELKAKLAGLLGVVPSKSVPR